MTANREFTVVGKAIPVKDAKEKVCGTLKYPVDFALPGMVYGKIVRSEQRARPHQEDRRHEGRGGARLRRHRHPRGRPRPRLARRLAQLHRPHLRRRRALLRRRDRRRRGADAVGGRGGAQPRRGRVRATAGRLRRGRGAAARTRRRCRRPATRASPTSTSGAISTRARRRPTSPSSADVKFGSQQMAPDGRNAAIAEWNGDKVTLYTGSQSPSELRDGLAQAFGIPQSKTRVVALPLGASFGEFWSNNFMMVAPLLAKKVRRPVKIELTNEECMAYRQAAPQGALPGQHGLHEGRRDHLHRRVPHHGQRRLRLQGRGRLLQHRQLGRSRAQRPLRVPGCLDQPRDRRLHARRRRHHHGLDRRAAAPTSSPRSAASTRSSSASATRSSRAIRCARHGRRPSCAATRRTGASSCGRTAREAPQGLARELPKLFHLSSGSSEEHPAQGRRGLRLEGQVRRLGQALLRRRTQAPRRRRRHRHPPVRRRDGGQDRRRGAHHEGRQRQGLLLRRTPRHLRRHDAGADRRRDSGHPDRHASRSRCGDTDACPWSRGSLASTTLFRTGFKVWAACLDARRQLLELAAQRVLRHRRPSASLDIRDGCIFSTRPSGCTLGRGLRHRREKQSRSPTS